MRIPECYARAGRLLNGSPRLEALQIRFRSLPEWEAENKELFWSPLLPAHILGPKSHYPRLKHLHIDTYICDLDDWLSFFERHGPTLESLDIGSIRLQNSQLNGPAPCWVGVLKEMQRQLNLKNIKFNGVLMNGLQTWNVRDERRANTAFLVMARSCKSMDLAAITGNSERLVVDFEEAAGINTPVFYDEEKCLKAQVERWFVDGGTCPLEAWKDPHGLGESTVDWSWRGDYSWRSERRPS
jgi:hypothetical protein